MDESSVRFLGFFLSFPRPRLAPKAFSGDRRKARRQESNQVLEDVVSRAFSKN
jgi:hypothetical protein